MSMFSASTSTPKMSLLGYTRSKICPGRADFAFPLRVGSPSFARTLLGCVLIQLCTLSSTAQRPASDQATSDPQAVAIVNKSIAALGGVTAWQSIGAATAKVTLSSTGIPTRTVAWAADWSLGYLRSRKDSVSASGQAVTTITLRDARIDRPANGKAVYYQRENDVSALAVGYPGVALLLSLGQYHCSFYLGKVHPYDEVGRDAAEPAHRIDEDCNDPLMPTGKAHLTWMLSADTGLPIEVRFPVRGLLHNSTQYATARYAAFRQVGGVMLPENITMTRPSGTVHHLSISDVSFTSALPSDTFEYTR